MLIDKKPANTTGYNLSVHSIIWKKRLYSKEIFIVNLKITPQPECASQMSCIVADNFILWVLALPWQPKKTGCIEIHNVLNWTSNWGYSQNKITQASFFLHLGRAWGLLRLLKRWSIIVNEIIQLAQGIDFLSILTRPVMKWFSCND